MTFFQTTRVLLLGASMTAPFVGCASTGTRPGDTGAANHEAMADKEQQNAADHAKQYDPNATQQAVGNCVGGYESASDCSATWTSVTNPTEKHRAEAASHRELAAKHRAASAALRDVEARSCQNVPAADRDMSPFDHREDIAQVTNIPEENGPSTEGRGRAGSGARIVFTARPGMTAEWLQRVVDCHIARNAVMNYQMPEMQSCPLDIKGATARVTTAGNGFAVDITANDSSVAKKIQSRARALVSNSNLVSTR